MLAVNQVQAGQAFRFVKGVFEESPALAPLIENVTADSISLATQVDIRVQAASFRSIRGISAIAAIADELAFWLNEGDSSRNADREIVAALRPALATTGGPLIAISSPYAKRGELHGAFRKHYGLDGDPLVLVAHAPSRTMNPSFQRALSRAHTKTIRSRRKREYGGAVPVRLRTVHQPRNGRRSASPAALVSGPHLRASATARLSTLAEARVTV